MKSTYDSFRCISLALLCSGCLTACQNDGEVPGEEDPTPAQGTIDAISVWTDDIASDNLFTRSSYELDESTGLIFKWGTDDQIGIFPKQDKSTQIGFTFSSEEETSGAQRTAVFESMGWSLQKETSYVAYYPYKTDASIGQIEFSYEDQEQTGDGSTAHLGAYDYMYAEATKAVDDVLSFHFHHLNSVVQLKLNVPVVATFDQLTLFSDEAIFAHKGVLSLSGDTYS